MYYLYAAHHHYTTLHYTLLHFAQRVSLARTIHMHTCHRQCWKRCSGIVILRLLVSLYCIHIHAHIYTHIYTYTHTHIHPHTHSGDSTNRYTARMLVCVLNNKFDLQPHAHSMDQMTEVLQKCYREKVCSVV
jgi:hypothetical protein